MEKEYSRTENDIAIQKLKALYDYFESRCSDSQDDLAVYCSLKKAKWRIDDAISEFQLLSEVLS